MLRFIQKWLHNNFLKKCGFGWFYRDLFLHFRILLTDDCTSGPVVSFTDIYIVGYSCFPLCCPHKTIVGSYTTISHKDDYMYHHYTGRWITSHRAGDAHFLFEDTGLACYFIVDNLCSMILNWCYFSIGGSFVLFPHFIFLHSLKLRQHEHW